MGFRLSNIYHIVSNVKDLFINGKSLITVVDSQVKWSVMENILFFIFRQTSPLLHKNHIDYVHTHEERHSIFFWLFTREIDRKKNLSVDVSVSQSDFISMVWTKMPRYLVFVFRLTCTHNGRREKRTKNQPTNAN